MSTSIEQKVVQMKFDNKQFESGIAQSMSTLEKFEKSLNFKGAAKSFESISKAADQVSLENLTKQTDNAGNKFDALAVIAISALNRITNEAISAGTKLVKSLSIDQVASGWSKYEARTAAVQTLVNATGKSVEDIEKYMDKLMLYSDETSYGFQDMTSALATMVSAGGDINKLVPLLEGFGNAVSYVGKGAAEYSRAIIQLSQGYGRNALMLEDWKSVEQTLGGAKQLKEVFIQVGEELDKIEKGEITIGTFNESLRDKWLDQEVMEKALGRFAEMTEKAFEMIEAGEAENVADAYAILSKSVDDYRIKAAKAAQEAKSFTEAIDATKDAVSTKWMESFQIIFGNYEEATQLWTELTNTLWDLFAASGDTRNEILNVWRSFEGREAMIDAAKAAFEALYVPVQAVGDAINEIFFPGTVEEKGLWLVSATEAVRDFFQSLILSEEAANTLRMGVKLLLIPVYALYQVLRLIGTLTAQTIMTIFALGNALLSLPSKLDSIESPLKRIFGEERYIKIVTAFSTIIDKLGATFTAIGASIRTIGKSMISAFSTKLMTSLSKLMEYLSPIAGWILDRIVDGFEYLARIDYTNVFGWVEGVIGFLVDGLKIITNLCSRGVEAIVNLFRSFFTLSPAEVLQNIINTLKTMKDNLVEFANSLGFGQLLEVLSTAGGKVVSVVVQLAQAVADFVSKLSAAKILVFTFGVTLVRFFYKITDTITAFGNVALGAEKVLNSTSTMIQVITDRIKGNPIKQMAQSIAIMSGSIVVLAVALGALSRVDSGQLMGAAKALAVVMTMMIALSSVLAIINKVALSTNTAASNLVKISKMILAVSVAIAALSSALFVLSKIDLDGIVLKLGALGVTLLMMSGAILAVNKLMATDEKLSNSVYLVAFALALNLMIRALDKISATSLTYTVDNIITIGLIVALMLALGASAQRLKLTTGLSMILFAGTLLLFAQTVKPLGDIEMGRVLQALTNMVLIFVPLALIGALTRIADKKFGVNIAALATGIMIMYFAINKIGSLDIETVKKGTAAVSVILIFMGLFNRLSSIVIKDNEILKMNKSFLQLSAAILVLGLAIDYIGGISQNEVIQGTVIVSLLIVLLTILAKAVGSINKATGAVVAMGVCIGMLTAAMALLTLLDEMELLQVSASLLMAFTGIALMFKFIGEGLNAQKAIMAVILIQSTLWSIFAVFNLMNSFENSDTLITKAGAIGLVLVALGAACALINKSTKSSDWDNLKQLLTYMLPALGMVSGIVAMIGLLTQGMNVDGLIEKAGAISIVLIALSASMRILKTDIDKNTNIDGAIKVIATLGIVAGLATLLLSNLANPDQIIEKAGALSLVLAALTAATSVLIAFSLILDKVDSDIGKKMLAFGATAAILGGVAAGITVALSKIDGTQDMTNRLIGFVGVLAAMLVVGAVMPVVAKALDKVSYGTLATGILKIGEIVGLVGGLVAGLGAIINVFEWIAGDSSVEQMLDKGIAVIEKIGEAIGKFIGAIIGGIGAGVIDSIGPSIVNFGSNLSAFADNVQSFATLEIKESLVQSISRLAEAVTMIVNAEFMEQTRNFNREYSSLKLFGKQLEEFAPHFVRFSDKLKGIDIPTMTAGTNCIYAIAELLSQVPTEGGLIEAVIGNKDIDKFASGLSNLAIAVGDYAQIIAGGGIDEQTLSVTTTLTDTIVKLSEAIPKTGGWLQDIFGESDFELFGTRLESYGNSLKAFIDKSKEIYEVYDATKMGVVKDVTEDLIKLAEKVPETGVLITFFGGHDIGKFGTQLTEFGTGLAGFFDALKDTTVDEGLATSAKNAGATIAELSDQMPETGLIQDLLGGKNIGTFGEQVKNFGSGLASFFNAIDEANVDDSTISLANSAGSAFVNIANALDPAKVKNDFWTGSAFGNFADGLKKLGSGIKGFSDNSKGSDWSRVSSAVASLKTIVTFGEGITKLTPATATTFNSFLTNLANSGVSNFTSTFSTAETKMASAIRVSISNAMDTAKTDLMAQELSFTPIIDSIISGIEGHDDDIASRASKFATLTISTIEGQSDRLEQAGYTMLDSFLRGFEAMNEDERNRIRAVFNAIAMMTYVQFDIRSNESRYFKTIGEYCIAGYVSGIEASQTDATKAAKLLAQGVITEFESTLGVASPSKKFAEIGKFTMLGFIKGIEDNSDNAIDSIVKMGGSLLDSLKKLYGIHSPSTVMRDEIGRYIIQGIAEGITKDMSAEQAAAQKAQNIMSAFQKELNKWTAQINIADLEYQLWSTINRSADEVQIREQEILNLEKKLTAEAERYNATKAQYDAVVEIGDEDAIRDAYNALIQEEISMRELTYQLADLKNAVIEKNWNLDIKTAELENTLWSTMNRDASNVQSNAQQEQLLNKKLDAQAEIVTAAENNYQKAIALYGETSDITKEAYNTYIEAQTSLWELANSLSDLIRGVNNDEEAPTRQDMINAANAEYQKIVELFTPLIGERFESEEDLHNYALVASGIQDLLDNMSRAKISDPAELVGEAMSKAKGVIEIPITVNPDEILEEYLSKASGSIGGIAGNVQHITINTGSGSGGTSTSGLGLDPTSITQDIENTINQVTESLGMGQIGEVLGLDFIDGIRNNLGGVGDALIDATKSGFASFKNFLGIGDGSSTKSGTSILKDLGSSIMKVLGIGMEESTDAPVDAAKNAAVAVNAEIEGLPDDWQEVGYNAAEGMALGIQNGSSIITDAASNAASQALEATKQALDSHSPSREYYYIGEMMDQGMANGLVDATSVVTRAIQDVLSDAQDTAFDNAISASITPVIDDTSLRQTQRLTYEANGTVTPHGYRDDESMWWTSELTTAIQQLSATEEARRVAEDLAMAEYKATLDELKTAVRTMADKPTGVSVTQNNYSPKALSSSTIYRNTKTALASASAKASPTGKSIKSDT